MNRAPASLVVTVPPAPPSYHHAVSEASFVDLLERDDAIALMRAGQRRLYPARTMLLSEGDEGHQVLVLRDGFVKVQATAGRIDVVLDVLGPGDLLGEVAAFDDGPRSATAMSLTAVELVVVPGAAFVALVDQRRGMDAAVRTHLARRLRHASQRQVEYGALDAVGRVGRRVVELADRFGEPADDGIRIAVPLTQSELAGWAGLSREATVKALRELRERGLVRTAPKSIVVIDLDAVRRL